MSRVFKEIYFKVSLPLNSRGDKLKPKVLIVGTVPYNKKSTSRAFESYFSGWEKENLAQVFSNTKKPTKGHCGSFYQITDRQMLKSRLNKNYETGLIYSSEELEDAWTDNSLEVKEALFRRMYYIGSKHTPMTHLIRKWVWKKKLWCTEKFNAWLEEFKPQCVFLSFSDDFFILEIAVYVAEKFNIPIVSSWHVFDNLIIILTLNFRYHHFIASTRRAIAV